MRKFLKPFTLLCVFLLTIGLIACGSTDNAGEKKSEEKVETAKIEETEHKADEQKAAQEVAVNDEAALSEEKQTEQASPSTTKEKTNETSRAKSPVKKEVNTSNNAAAAPSKPSASTSTQTALSQPVPSQPTTGGSANQNTTTENEKPAPSVTFSIVGPDNHVILAAKKINIKDGDTVFDVLKGSGVSYEKTGSGATLYISGIEDYYQFDYGPMSGWVFTQNGASLTLGAGVTKVKDGDRIECFYTQ